MGGRRYKTLEISCLKTNSVWMSQEPNIASVMNIKDVEALFFCTKYTHKIRKFTGEIW